MSETIVNPIVNEELQEMSGTTFTSRLISVGITVLLIAASVTSLAFLLIGSVKWITSGGDREALVKAQRTVTMAAIGLALSFSTWAIFRLIGYFFGIDLLAIDWGTVHLVPPAPAS